MPIRGGGWIQGYNCQLAVSADYLILATEPSTDPNHTASYQPMITATSDTITEINTATGAGLRLT